MIKLKFLVNVPDKYTKEQYKEGQEKEFNNKRAEEILSAKQKNGQPYAIEVIEEVETAIKILRKKHLQRKQQLKRLQIQERRNNHDNETMCKMPKNNTSS